MASFREFTPVPVARAEKFTEVKEGQQHPVGKGGQLKLFHEHVWPKGYTPERIKAVNNMHFVVNGSPNLHPEYEHNVTPIPDMLHRMTPAGDKIAKSLVTESIARSTAPISDLKKLHRPSGQLAIIARKSMYNPTYNTNTHEVNLNISDAEIGNRGIYQSGPTSTNIQTTLLHEVGHALDLTQNPKEYDDEWEAAQKDPNKYKHGGINPTRSLPRTEGVAEGYRLAHARVTRGQKRRDQDAAGGVYGLRQIGSDVGTVPGYGYNPNQWSSAESTTTFVQARNDTFKQATGHHFENMEDPPAPTKKPEQLNLFD
jgi:hypothetical protein